MEQDFTVHDVVLQHQIRLASGHSKPVTHLSFFVGAQGPFFHDFEQGQDSPQLIQAHIANKVQELRQIVGRTY
jgi:hypothetical protein